MKIVLSVLAVALLIASAYGWTAIEQTDNTKDHPGHCYSENEEVGAMEKGEVKGSKTRCVKITCGEDSLIIFYGCGIRVVPQGWSLLPTDLSKPYPDCCPRPVRN